MVTKMDKYLDITKSVIISSPAGSGKTEKLARRYVSLLEGGSEIEKILAITFTEKAAAEMKERILRILEKENPSIFTNVREKMPLMRISTIHAFCLKLLKRFSIELGLDPSLHVTDEFNASLLWSEAVYESLLVEKEHPDLFFEMMVSRGIKGWDVLLRTLNELHSRRPIPEVMLTEDHRFSQEEVNLLTLYRRCLSRYTIKKREKHLIDFNDIEILTYEALLQNPQWQNILYSFDEHTDHILVDEFQDTSSLQWKIIDKLTEEWRSGLGAKRAAGKIPTIFLVGDEKQSIYLFRGSNVSVFHEAKKRFSEWLGEQYHFEEIRENYRSLPGIIDFTNSLFSRIMPPSLHETWRTRYTPFEATRTGDGRVELLLLEGMESTKKNREKEAFFLAKKISYLNDFHEIWDNEFHRPCTYGDMAILLRKRTHLPVFEDALRRHDIPFVVVKGIGFYDEPEVALLREFISLLIDPLDDHSLFCILRSPLFDIKYNTLLPLISRGNIPLLEKIRSSRNKKLMNAFVRISAWIERSYRTPLAVMIEEVLSETSAWQYFWEKQRHGNIRKFIAIIEQYESCGLSCLEIREKLISAKTGEEAKANINTEGMNAVKIMTMHAAKGLQFPIVFLPSLDEVNSPKSGPIVLMEDEGSIAFVYEEDSSKRRKNIHFQRQKEKELEEEKRLFYVAVTRAKDYLCMLGVPKKDQPHTGRLGYITGNLEHLSSLSVIHEQETERIWSSRGTTSRPPSFSHDGLFSGPSYTEQIPYEPAVKWRDVTESMDIRITHGEDWVLLGRVFHSLFESLSKGTLKPEEVTEKARFLLRNELFSGRDVEGLISIIKEDFQKLRLSGHLENIILPKERSFAELPFILHKGDIAYRGRIDRVIIQENTIMIYDYKTFPARSREIPELLEKYRFQMEIYREAAEKIFSLASKGFILFTHLPSLTGL